MIDTEITPLLTACQAIVSATTLPQIVGHLLEAAMREMQPSRVLILISENDTMVAAATHGFTDAETHAHTTPFTDYAASRQKSLRLHADEAHPLWQHRGEGVQSIACLPMLRGGRLIGVLYLESTEHGHRFSETSQAHLEAVVTQAAAALENIELSKKLRTLEHDMRNALSAANLLLFQILGSELEGQENYVVSIKDSDKVELSTLGTMAPHIADETERDDYLAHLGTLVANRETADELLRGVRNAVNRALTITSRLEDKRSQALVAKSGALAAKRLVSSR